MSADAASGKAYRTPRFYACYLLQSDTKGKRTYVRPAPLPSLE